tara:strand:- start:698 stop:844 length:147 start_codon:yes stop_codon:yes gene_type:complete
MLNLPEDSIYKYPHQTGLEIQIIDPSVNSQPEDSLGGSTEINNVLEDL